MIRTPLHARAFVKVRTLSAYAVLAGTLVTSACNSVKVRTITAPNARVARMVTFRILDSPLEQAIVHTNGNGSNGSNGSNVMNESYGAIVRNSLGTPLYMDPTKPMLNNTIALEAGREFVRDALLMRGFVEDPVNPDFEVAFYAAAQERIDIRDYGYNYGYYGGYDGYDVYVYTEGTVLIDLVNPDTKQLIWRGSGEGEVSNKPRKYLDKLSRMVYEIVDRVPPPGPVPLVSRRLD